MRSHDSFRGRFYTACFSLLIPLWTCFHLRIKLSKSACSSSALCPLATVRMMTPKPLGLMLLTNFFQPVFLLTFANLLTHAYAIRERQQALQKRPAMLSSAVILGPFVEIGSLVYLNQDLITLLKHITNIAFFLDVSRKFQNW